MGDLALGIDTGGTFTDGVVIDLKSRDILTATKQVTKRDNLALSIDNCFVELLKSDRVSAEDIELVSLSTTLATNAIVEGQGAAVGAVLIGFDPPSDLPTAHSVKVAGGCTIKGNIKEEINKEEIKKAVNEMASKVDAFAICGYLSVRNPVQEQRVAEIVESETSYPVVQGHRLSSELGFQERAVTAVFNARLLPLITDLIDSVRSKLKEYGIDAPLMVVKGDGSLISSKEARKWPVETSLSGPAASAIGARHLAGIDEGIIIDIGGTTTDLALLRDGKLRLSEKGARVGGWLTRVKAAELTTIGLGGDSQIQVDKAGQLSIGPQRVFPLSWIVDQHPYLKKELKNIKEKDYFPLNHQPVTVLVYIKDPVKFNLSPMQKKLMEVLRKKPHTIKKLGEKLKIDPEVLPWNQLVKTGCLHRAGLTPTDMLHFEGEFKEWNKKAAELAMEVTAARMGISPEKLTAVIRERIEVKLGKLVFESVIRDEGISLDFEREETEYFINKILGAEKFKNNAGKDIIDYESELNLPLVGVGAPARAYFPGIVERLKAKLYLPEWAEVANALGTVMGEIVEQIKVIIKPDEVGAGYVVHTPEKRLGFKQFEEAIKNGEKLGKKYVRKKVEKSNARDVEIFVDRNDKYGKFAGGRKEDNIFIETILNISAVGKPW